MLGPGFGDLRFACFSAVENCKPVFCFFCDWLGSFIILHVLCHHLKFSDYQLLLKNTNFKQANAFSVFFLKHLNDLKFLLHL